jgi:hypothetical protein
MNKNKTVAKLLTTSAADVYSVPSAFKAEVDSIVITNASNSHIDVTVQWYEASTNTTHDIAVDLRMTPNSLLQLTNAFYLDKNDKITAYASVTSVITINIRTREYFAERL